MDLRTLSYDELRALEARVFHRMIRDFIPDPAREATQRRWIAIVDELEARTKDQSA